MMANQQNVKLKKQLQLDIQVKLCFIQKKKDKDGFLLNWTTDLFNDFEDIKEIKIIKEY